MDLSYFNFLAEHIINDKCLREKFLWETAIYRWHENKWYEKKTVISNQKITEQLKTIRSLKKNSRIQNQDFTLIENLDAIIVTTIPLKTRKTTIEDFHNHLKIAISNAEHKFYATHDKLTRLNNRVGFERDFKEKLSSMSTSGSPNLNSTSSNQYIALLIADIDHFKQVNDSYDHSFGDAVLKAFAWRIKDYAAELEQHHKIEITLGRQGGEEFEILLTNLREKAQAIKIAELFREKINAEVIPSPAQLPAIMKELELDKKSIPPEKERHIRASIGCAVLSCKTIKVDAANKMYAELKRKADAALYRAKGDGRDRVRDYDHILRKHGHVIKFFPEVNLVAIDLGEEVGAMAGYVFEVTPSEFSGEQELTKEDTRSTRALGMIPRVATAKIVIVEVQREISFCKIIESVGNNPFPQNANLKKIPYGINTPILDSAPPILKSALCSYSAFESTLNQLDNFSGIAFISIEPKIDLKNTIIEKLGKGAQRKNLRIFVHRLRIILPPKTLFGFVDDKTIILKFDKLDETIDGYIEKIASISIENHQIKIGALLESSLQELMAEGVNHSPEAILFYSRLAHFVATKEEKENVVVFKEKSTPLQALYYLRRDGRKSDALLEYHRLSNYGIKNPNLDNQLGITLLEMNDSAFFLVAEQAMENAIAFDDDEVTFKANLAIVKTKMGKNKEAYELFIKAKTFMQASKLYWLYSLSYAKAAIEQYNLDKTSIKLPDLTKILQKAQADSIPTTGQENEWFYEIEKFLKSSR